MSKRTMDFWDAVRKVAERCPMAEWTWADWLSVIDLADVPCYHPVRYRLCVGGYWKEDGTRVDVVSDQRVVEPRVLCGVELPAPIEKMARDGYGDNPYITWCEVCQTFCPSPPVDVRAKRKKMLAKILHTVVEADRYAAWLEDEWG